MSVPGDSNSQDNYDSIMGAIMDPSMHPVDNIPQASIQHDGTQLPVASQPKSQSGSMGSAKRETVGEQALQALKARLEGGTTVTKGKGKRK